MAAAYIYHLVEESRWKEAGAEGYLPRTYEADGFIHATKEAELLLPVANHFYTDIPGTFLCLRIDPAILKSEVKYEAAAKVGKKAAAHVKSPEQLFPHIYGPIENASVIDELAVSRSEDGAFLSIESIAK